MKFMNEGKKRRQHMKRKKWLFCLAGFVVIAVFLAFAPAVRAQNVTDAQIASAIKGGQKYLYDNFHDNGDGTGYFGTSGYTLASTASAVSALLETGTYSDPAYKAIIDKAIAYIKSGTNNFIKPDGSIYESNVTYETGIALTALALYGQATSQDAAYRTIVQNAINFLIGCQNTDEAYNTFGGWGYDGSYKTGS